MFATFQGLNFNSPFSGYSVGIMLPRYLLISPLLLTPLAQAADCANASTQAAMNQCAAEQHQAADRN